MNYNKLKCNSKNIINHTRDYQAKTISLFSQPYLDRYEQCYKNIVVVNLKPMGPLSDLIRPVKFPPLSEFGQLSNCSCPPFKNCGYAIKSLNGCNYGSTKYDRDLMVVDEIPDLISFLKNNDYSIDTSTTKMFNTSEIKFNNDNKLIFFITYNGALK